MNTISELESVILEDSLLHQNLSSILCVSASACFQECSESSHSFHAFAAFAELNGLPFSTPVTRWERFQPLSCPPERSLQRAWLILKICSSRLRLYLVWNLEDEAYPNTWGDRIWVGGGGQGWNRTAASHGVTAEPSFPSYVAAATPTVPRQEWHATWMRWKWGLSRDFPLNKENILFVEILLQ